MEVIIYGWIVSASLGIIFLSYHLFETKRKLDEHTKQRHKRYRKREKVPGNIIGDTLINNTKVSGSD